MPLDLDDPRIGNLSSHAAEIHQLATDFKYQIDALSRGFLTPQSILATYGALQQAVKDFGDTLKDLRDNPIVNP